jgi:hypothetical protein
MSRTDKDLHWRLREWPSWIGKWGIHCALSHPRRAERHGYWYGPDRARSRRECQEMRREYNTTGDVDTTPTTNQHRHQAEWWSC